MKVAAPHTGAADADESPGMGSGAGPASRDPDQLPSTGGSNPAVTVSLGTRFTLYTQLRPTPALSERETGPSGPKNE
jgi:hypothetical protein